MDDYFALQPTGIHSDSLLPSAATEGYTSPLDSPEPALEQEQEQEQEQKQEKEVEGARKKAVLSPSERVSVLDQALSAAPPPDARSFLSRFLPLSVSLANHIRNYRILTRRTTTIGTGRSFRFSRCWDYRSSNGETDRYG